MEIIIGLFFLLLIGYILIKLWIKIVNFFMNPLIKWTERKSNKFSIEKNQEQKQEKFKFIQTDIKKEYKSDNLTKKTEYKDYFITSDYGSRFDKWFVNDGDFVNIEEPVYQYDDTNNNRRIIYSNKAGYVHLINPRRYGTISNNELMFIVRDSDEQRVKELFINEPNIIIDDFTNSTIIKWNRVSDKNSIYKGIETISDDSMIDFLFSFNFIDNKDFIVFNFNPKQINPKQFDKISFLFENGEQIEFELATNPIKNNRKDLEYKGIITQSELELFAKINFKKWKISLVSDKREILGGENSKYQLYSSKNNIQIVIKKFAMEYIDLVKKTIPNYQPTELKQIESNKGNLDDFCFVYLMHDTSNGYYKIGISNNPEYRERTLQSEKPTIEIIVSKKFPIRKIAESIEKALHNTYSEKRLRGEWFELDIKDVENIKGTLK